MIPTSFHILIKPRGSICNLNCTYCFYLSKKEFYPDSDMVMSDEILEEFTRQYIISQKVPEIIFGWQGGEPTLMGVNFFKKALYFQKKYSRPGLKVFNTLQTNGTLLNDEWGEFLRENKFLVGLSIDGSHPLHDSFRVDQKGNPTLNQVLQGLEILKKHGVQYNVLVCVHSKNVSQPLKVYYYLRDELKAHYIQFIPIVETSKYSNTKNKTRILPYSISGVEYGNFMVKIFDEWIKKDVGSIFIQLFDISLGMWLNIPSSLCIFSPTCGRTLVLEHNGDLYSCDHFVDQNHYLGNIMRKAMCDLANSQQQQAFGLMKRDSLAKICLECNYLFACAGGCPKNRIIILQDQGKKLNYLCKGYKSFFNHIDPYMREISNLLRKGRTAADIMLNLDKIKH